MCSIAGSPTETQTKKMLQTMKHRAPDDEQIFSDVRFSIGMGRLSIIDLKSPGLCLFNLGNHYLTFNGEIYNYKELRRELEVIGEHFETDSDTEVLLKSYLVWGYDCVKRFNGMFAFAIYDGQKVFFARDIAGQKPLYYTFNPFQFASETKALNWKCVELLPGTCGIYDFATEKISLFSYWQKPKVKNWTQEEAEKELEYLLEDAVRLCTQSDVPYGLYYSGGVDSTLISTFHDFKYKFTYQDKDYKNEFLERFPRILWHLDYPIQSFSAFGLYKLAEEASKKVKVVISGEGADELFGGYVRFLPTALNEQARKIFPSYKTMFPVKRFNEVEILTEDLMWQEFTGNMRELLRMGDRMASAWGLENRCPFLDKRIIEFAFSLPLEFKIKGFETKVILNRILKKQLPDYQPIEKQGLFCSVNEWLEKKEEGFGKKSYYNYQLDLWRKRASS